MTPVAQSERHAVRQTSLILAAVLLFTPLLVPAQEQAEFDEIAAAADIRDINDM